MGRNDKIPEKEYHYFGSTPFDWAVGQTRQELFRRLAERAPPDTIKSSVKNFGGLYVWTCRVKAPQSTPYNIENYAPYGVECDSVQEHRIIHVKGYLASFDKE